ncbi:fumarylacetoacetate hydrolase family protein [Dankookia sp. P2]|uniref:fumarylacetoacetate hydrolase family protein n=1 Tax=Dankookia sp. P2 TaxID=3423955 RepID=UPI003D66498B
MSDYVIAPPVIAALPIQGSRQMFPVRRIFCVGRNYAEHAIEMGLDPTREPPFYFAKPADALVVNDADMPYPPASKSLHHEMELVVAIGSAGANHQRRGRAQACSRAIVPASTLTRRDPAERGEEDRPSLGHGQGLRPFGADGRAGAGQGDRCLQGEDRAQGERQGHPDLRPLEADLVGAGGDLNLSHLVRLAPGDLISDRHAGRRRRSAEGRPAGVASSRASAR